MAEFDVENAFVGSLWQASEIEGYRDQLMEIMGRVEPEDLAYEAPRRVYATLRQKLVAGEPATLTLVFVDSGLTLDDVTVVYESHEDGEGLAAMADLILADAKRARILGLLTTASNVIRTLPREDLERAADKLALRLMEQNAKGQTGGSYAKEDVIQIGIDRSANPVNGVVLPWKPLHYEAGPWIPGEIVGVTAYSGDGKSTLAANLFAQFGAMGYPMIVYPTEMRMQWFDRVAAIKSGTSAWRAEKGQWYGHEEERQQFVKGYKALEDWNWVMPRAANFSPEEIVISTRILRRRWPNRPVIVFVDHMHRLRYEGDPDKEVGPATMLLKELAQNEGLIVIALYQPKKPLDQAVRYGPPAAHQIRGASMVWNELDCCLAPFRQWVKVSEMGKTEWGTAPCIYGDHGWPKTAKPNDENGKLDDEHFYVKVDKRRVGGEGPIVMLNYHPPSNQIFHDAEEHVPGLRDPASKRLLGLLDKAGYDPEEIEV